MKQQQLRVLPYKTLVSVLYRTIFMNSVFDLFGVEMRHFQFCKIWMFECYANVKYFCSCSLIVNIRSLVEGIIDFTSWNCSHCFTVGGFCL